jgi:hypothetical protein
MPTFFSELVITEAPMQEAIEFEPQVVSKIAKYHKLFNVLGGDFPGYVVAQAVFWHEDKGGYSDRSHFSGPVPILM